jgi:hypothetical protein
VTVPRLTLLLLLLAAALHLAIARPAARALGEAGDEYRKARNERAAHESRLALSERRARAQERAMALLARAAYPTLPAVRRHVLAQLAGLPLVDVRLEVKATKPPAFAEIKLAAQGDFHDLVTLAARLGRRDTGLALESVAFARSERDERVKLTVTAETVARQP